MELHITGDAAADKLLSDDAFALLTGMLLDQQVTMESAFAGPEKIRTRLGSLEPSRHCRSRSRRLHRSLQGEAGRPSLPRFHGRQSPSPGGNGPQRLEW